MSCGKMLAEGSCEDSEGASIDTGEDRQDFFAVGRLSVVALIYLGVRVFIPMKRHPLVHGLLAVLALCHTTPVVASPPPTHAWETPREISTFAKLLSHSPFSLPTAEESSPLAERYAMTGIITLNGEDQVFVFDRTDQSRELLTANPNAKNMSLLSLVREGNNPVKASIRIGSEVGTIGFMDAAPAPAAVQPSAPVPATGLNLPPMPPTPNSPAINPPGRRIIRRPVVTAPQSPKPATP